MRALSAPARAIFLHMSAAVGAAASTTARSGVSIRQFPCRSDNYGFLLRDEASGLTAAIDTPDAGAVVKVCEAAGWTLTHVLNTHHHADHTGGNNELKSRYGCEIIGCDADRRRIPGIDRGVSAGDEFKLGSTSVHVLDVSGHTIGHIAYHLPEERIVFVGDSLFALGCGRLFEGTPEMAWASLQRLAALPAETAVFCAHEYTQANAKFALSVDPSNASLKQRAAEIDAARRDGKPTVPTTIRAELETNPFLRAQSAAIRELLGMRESSDVDVFAEIRRRKDAF